VSLPLLFFHEKNSDPRRAQRPGGVGPYVFDLEGVELGKYALQLPPPSDTKVTPVDEGTAAGGLSKPHHLVELSAIELQPLIQSIESAESHNSKNLKA
jgi:hypothetical protein